VFFGLFSDKNAVFQTKNKTGSIGNAAFLIEPAPDYIADAAPVFPPATSLQQDAVFAFKPVSGAFVCVANAIENTPHLCADAPDAPALCLFGIRNVVPVCRKEQKRCRKWTDGRVDNDRAFCLAVNRTRPTPNAPMPLKLFFVCVRISRDRPGSLESNAVGDTCIYGGIGAFSGFGVPALHLKRPARRQKETGRLESPPVTG